MTIGIGGGTMRHIAARMANNEAGNNAAMRAMRIKRVRGPVPQPEIHYGTWTRLMNAVIEAGRGSYIEFTWHGEASTMRTGIKTAAWRRGYRVDIQQIKPGRWAASLGAKRKAVGR